MALRTGRPGRRAAFLCCSSSSWATGIDLTSVVGGGGSAPPASVGTSGEANTTPAEEKLVDMVDAVMDDAQ